MYSNCVDQGQRVTATPDLCASTKFEADSSIHSKVIRGSQNFEIWSRDLGHAHLGVVLLSTRRRRPFYVCTKFEADSSISSKVIRGPKIRILGHVTQATPTYVSFYGPHAAEVRPL